MNKSLLRWWKCSRIKPSLNCTHYF